ncbi:PREDICTED: vitellogenin receptor isoform X2 [Vollenhovia emeryi]|uniref:vitellogenin receptor isoform X2 n=1 Tax=Vollenhovia emeryi TaxID=411798 RepID=UPI0005F56797|nr:PREDICTED: vitellogenin receptor isoform X2 [Vollenhovia emeryi]
MNQIAMPRLKVLLSICSFFCLLNSCYSIFLDDLFGSSAIQCQFGTFKCKSRDICIPSRKRCNGNSDCEDGSDEENCTEYNEYKKDVDTERGGSLKCDENHYQCTHLHECIPAGKFCDQVTDCIDESDEYDKCEHDLRCVNQFRCNNSYCVHKEWVCDGKSDCSDGSDEWNCTGKTGCKIENSQFLCANNRCLDFNAVCNKRNDCGDGSDEGVDCTLPCLKKCDHECKQIPKGRGVCTCKRGYRLKDDNHTCIDIDECKIYGICDQICVNSPGSYSCACQKEYFLDNDKRTCIAHAGEALLAFSTTKEIIGKYINSNVSFTLASNLTRASAVAMNGRDHLYWADIENGDEVIIKRIPYEPHDVIVTTGLQKISGIAVDWITENIYFTDSIYGRIGVCDSNGINCTVLIEKISLPTGITLLPTRGNMYWCEAGFRARIAVAGMDGRNVQTLATKTMNWPTSLTIDYPTERLYWVDVKLQMITSMRLDGTDRRLVLHDMINEPFSLAVFENKLYWTDSESNMLQSCDKFSGKNWRILHRTFDDLSGVHIDHSAIKPQIENPCKSKPCSQLCLLNQDKGYTCACTLDKALDVDKKTCREKKQRLLIITRESFTTYYRGLLGKPKTINYSLRSINVHNIQSIRHFISDPISGRVMIFYDVLPCWFTLYNPVSNLFEEPRVWNNFSMAEIAFDYIGNNLYLPVMLNRSIEVQNIKTQAITKLYLKDAPMSIALAPEESKMFVLLQTWDKNYRIRFAIYEMRMDGLGERKLIKDNTGLVLMYYDRDSKTLFIYEKSHGNILSYSESTGTRVRRTGFTKPFTSFAVADNQLFWTELSRTESPTLHWLHLNLPKNSFPIGRQFLKINGSSTRSSLFVVTLRNDVKSEHGCQKNNGNCSHVCLVSSATSFTCACPPEMELSNDDRTCISHHKCPENEYKCSEHKLCIKKEQLCDGIVNCPSGEDETIDCKKKQGGCKEDEFTCKNGECIRSKDRCNSYFNCADRSDEENCEHPKCTSGEFQCYDGTCILLSKVCNVHFDCPDLSDETPDSCNLVTCRPDQFRCNDRKCIPIGFLCDGDSDCGFGEDEAPEKCHRNAKLKVVEVKVCPSGFYRCVNGNCISAALQCDRINDCGDNSDERHCLFTSSRSFNCTLGEYRCLDTDKCIRKELRCDGVSNCPKHDDEHNCNECFEHEFSCGNNKCIPESWVCDGKSDCNDKSDEMRCDGSRQIFNKSGICTDFQCSVGTCLSYDKVCDGIGDCIDGSDEGRACQRACAVDNYCKGVCYKTPSGPICGCQSGYRLANDTISCEDINECEYDICAQICQNTMGSYECSCYNGYVIRNDRVSCKSAATTRMESIFITEKDIRKVSNRFHTSELVHTFASPSISGFDEINGFVYWSDDEFGTINKINVKTKEVITVYDVIHPQALAVDSITDNVYVIDNNHPNTINVCDLEKERCATLVKIKDKAKATSLVIDYTNKLLIWSQVTLQANQSHSEICRTNLMGDDMKIINSDVGYVATIAIDRIKSKIYWLNNFKKTIESSDLDGSRHWVFMRIKMVYPPKIFIHDQELYWITGTRGDTYVCKLYGTKECGVQSTSHPASSDINSPLIYLHITSGPSDKNPCDGKSCEYMCVQANDNAMCICSDGKPMNSSDTCANKLQHVAGIISSSKNTRNATGIYSVTIIVLLIGVLVLCIFYYYQKYRLKSKSADDYSNSSIRFQNPSYDRSDEVEVIMNSIITENLAPGEHEYTNPIDDNIVKAATASSDAPRSDLCVEERY